MPSHWCSFSESTLEGFVNKTLLDVFALSGLSAKTRTVLIPFCPLIFIKLGALSWQWLSMWPGFPHLKHTFWLIKYSVECLGYAYFFHEWDALFFTTFLSAVYCMFKKKSMTSYSAEVAFDGCSDEASCFGYVHGTFASASSNYSAQCSIKDFRLC